MKIDLTPLEKSIDTFCKQYTKTHGTCQHCPFQYFHCDITATIENEIETLFKAIEKADINITENDVFIG